MSEQRLDIGLVVARKALGSPWADRAWLPHAVLPAAPGLAVWTPIATGDGVELFYAGPCEIALHSGAAEHYRDNLASGRPSLWVVLASAEGACAVTVVTADPYEGEALTEGLDVLVEPVPMPSAIQARVAAFVADHLVERPFIKRQRDRAGTDIAGGGR